VNLRAFLEVQGVSARDIDDAVSSARRVTKVASLASELIATALVEASKKFDNERAKAIALKGAFFAMQIHEGAEKLVMPKPMPKDNGR
jgi:hypothetical protein